jgi:hypothetical protein
LTSYNIVTFAIALLFASATSAQTIFFGHTKDSFSATGYWTATDTKIKPSWQSETIVDCDKNIMMCVEATAEFYMGHPHASLSYLHVMRWDNDGIIATDSSGVCMTVTMQISFAEKRISSTHSVKELDAETKEACKHLQADETEEDIFVLKGSVRWKKEHSFIPGKSDN